jgi:hypothetical protein
MFRIAQVEYKLKKWKFRRNVSAKGWKYVDHELSKRRKANKASEVILSGVRIKQSTIERETQRNRPVFAVQGTFTPFLLILLVLMPL